MLDLSIGVDSAVTTKKPACLTAPRGARPRPGAGRPALQLRLDFGVALGRPGAGKVERAQRLPVGKPALDSPVALQALGDLPLAPPWPPRCKLGITPQFDTVRIGIARTRRSNLHCPLHHRPGGSGRPGLSGAMHQSVFAQLRLGVRSTPSVTPHYQGSQKQCRLSFQYRT